MMSTRKTCKLVKAAHKGPSTTATQGPRSPKSSLSKELEQHTLCATYRLPLAGCSSRVWLPRYLMIRLRAREEESNWQNLARFTDPARRHRAARRLLVLRFVAHGRR